MENFQLMIWWYGIVRKVHLTQLISLLRIYRLDRLQKSKKKKSMFRISHKMFIVFQKVKTYKYIYIYIYKQTKGYKSAYRFL